MNVIINFQIEGCHNWPRAKEIFPEVGFLSDRHRHMFHICCKKKVTHTDRDIEIIMLKRDIIDWFHKNYYSTTTRCLEFGPMSCEMIVEELINQFDLCYCSVLEDGENGAEDFKNVNIKE